MNNLKQRARNCMIGLAIGDSLSWPAMYNRSFLLPPWTRRIRREIDAASETSNVILNSMPFSLNQPADHFDISPTCVTEWAAFSAQIILNNDSVSYKESIIREWKKLANSEEIIRGGVSTQAALHNLRNGIEPPQSGKENPHYFDDGAMARAIPIGIICAGKPEKAAHLAAIDASVSNSEDGVWAAQAMAAAISLVCSNAGIIDAISTAKQFLPEYSWIRRTMNETFEIIEKSNSIFSIMPELHKNIINREYSYGNVAPETLAVTFAIARLHGDNFETAVTSALGFAKCGETLPAMVGALSGAMNSGVIAESGWMNAIGSLKGISIPSFAGKDYLDLTEQLIIFEGDKISI